MPRQARLDAPGALHHVMIRGIERSPIFKDDQDRQDFISRTGMVAQGTGTKILAWALMNNHVHLLFFKIGGRNPQDSTASWLSDNFKCTSVATSVLPSDCGGGQS
jgi:REP element-mobilizing transposase RayT